MTDEQVAVSLAELNEKCVSFNDRLEKQEDERKTIRELVVQIKTMAVNMQYMIEEQKKLGERLNSLEKQPASNWEKIKATAISTVVSTIVASIVVVLVIAIANVM